MAFYYDTGFKRPVAQKLFDTASWDNGELCIAIYSGTQPSDADFLSDWGTNYYYNSGNGSAGSNLLGVYGDITNSNVTSDILTVSDIGGATNSDAYAWHVADTGIKKTWFGNGTAAWGVVWRATDFQVLAQSTVPYSVRYIIGPVTNSGGNGMIKIASTTVSDPIPDFEDLSINVTMA